MLIASCDYSRWNRGILVSMSDILVPSVCTQGGDRQVCPVGNISLYISSSPRDARIERHLQTMISAWDGPIFAWAADTAQAGFLADTMGRGADLAFYDEYIDPLAQIDWEDTSHYDAELMVYFQVLMRSFFDGYPDNRWEASAAHLLVLLAKWVADRSDENICTIPMLRLAFDALRSAPLAIVSQNYTADIFRVLDRSGDLYERRGIEAEASRMFPAIEDSIARLYSQHAIRPPRRYRRLPVEKRVVIAPPMLEEDMPVHAASVQVLLKKFVKQAESIGHPAMVLLFGPTWIPFNGRNATPLISEDHRIFLFAETLRDARLRCVEKSENIKDRARAFFLGDITHAGDVEYFSNLGGKDYAQCPATKMLPISSILDTTRPLLVVSRDYRPGLLDDAIFQKDP